MKKYIANMILIIGVSLLTMWMLMGSAGLSQFIGYLTRLAPKWIAIGFICIGLYWALETMIQYLLVRKMYRGNHLWNSFKVVMTGHFFNAITPFASGGQPMQAFVMMKQGVPLGTSASVLLSKFIIYQIILTLYSLVVLVMELKFFIVKVQGIIYLSLVGFLVNLGVVIILIMAVLKGEYVKKIGFWLINLLNKMHINRSPSTYKRKIIKQVDLFNSNIKVIKENKRLLLRVCILTVAQLTAYFVIPYAVYRAFGLRGTEMFVMISASAFIVMFSSFVPIPGGAGVAEGSFFLLFQLFFPSPILPAAILCWRVITFYVPLCLGGVITILPNQKNEYNKVKVVQEYNSFF